MTAVPDLGPVITAVSPAADVITDFLHAARSAPERTALEHNGFSTSYRQLEQQVRQLAAARRQGLPGQGRRVGVLARHVPATAAQLLAVLLAGDVYCPLDAALPQARLESLADALSLDELTDTDPTVGATVQRPIPAPDPEAPAYLLCTSGSTGRPKPVVVPRRALTAATRALRELFSLTPSDRVLQFASLGWDTCLEEIVPTLTAGAAVVFDDDAHVGSFPRFLRMLERRAITVIDLPTAFWHELVLFLHEERASLPAGVRLVVIGGERTDPTRLRQWRDLDTGHVQLLNTYGCTETTMITHAVALSGPGTAGGSIDADVPLGRALPHVVDRISDEGELLVGGPGLASGYLGMPEATAAAFPQTAGRETWFRTGDVVTCEDDGLLYSRGRVDDQLKISGVRVHPVEVEAHLNTHPAIAGAVVTGRRRLGRTALVAHVVAVGDVTGAELKRYLRRRLPVQFVPTTVVFVAALAYTATGKVDRAATARVQAGNEGATP